MNNEVNKSGKIIHCIDNWQKICSDQFILNTVQGYAIEFIMEPQQYCLPKPINLSFTEQNIIDNEILRLLANSAICKVQECENQFISPIFLVPKSDGGHRLVLNLKNLNNFVYSPHFKMEDYRTVCNVITKNCYMAVVDLKDAYHSVSIADAFRKFLRFIWKDKIYEYRCLPFGLSSAPFVFTKLMKPVLGYLRSAGFLNVGFLDDFLLFGQTFSDCQKNVVFTTQLLQSLGFSINYEKSQLTPSKSIKYLGFIFDSESLTLRLTDEKVRDISNLCVRVSNEPSISILTCSKLIGTLVAASPAVEYGLLYIKQLEREKTVALFNAKNNYSTPMLLSIEARNDISWWTTIAKKNIKTIKKDFYDKVIFSDASLTGWGAHCEGIVTRGFWTEIDQKKHINVLELIACENAIRCFASPNDSI